MAQYYWSKMDNGDDKVQSSYQGTQTFFIVTFAYGEDRLWRSQHAFHQPTKISYIHALLESKFKYFKERRGSAYMSRSMNILMLFFVGKSDWRCRNCHSWWWWGSCSTHSEKYSGAEGPPNIPFPHWDEGATLLGDSSGMPMFYLCQMVKVHKYTYLSNFVLIRWRWCWEV